MNRLWVALIVSTGGLAACQQTAPIGYEVASPLTLEKGSYGASQRDRYNKIFADAQDKRPPASEFLVECLARIAETRQREAPGAAAGSALDIAMGDGRNTIALAQHGYQVVGFDFADVGVNQARRRAAELGLKLDARVDCIGDAYFPENRWDVVALMYFGVDDNQLAKIKRSVKPGGYVIMEFAGAYPENGYVRRMLDWDIVKYESAWGGRAWAANQPNPGDGIRTRVLARRRNAE